MSALIVAVGVVAIVGAGLWFFIAQAPERAASHAGADEPDAHQASRSHFAPGDAGAEDQAVPETGQPGPSGSSRGSST